MFSAAVKSMYSKFTMAEKKIADYLLVNRGELEDVTSYELAERLGIGQSTVIRFSKKMGYRMFGELIEDVKHAKGSVATEIESDDAPHEILMKLGEQYCGFIDAVVKSNTGDNFIDAAHCINAASTVVCFGYLNSHLLAQYLADSLVELGIQAICENDYVQTKRRIQLLDPTHDVVVVISKSGEKSEPLGIADYAPSLGVHIVSISDAAGNALSRKSNINLKILENDNRSTPSPAMGTFAGVLLAIDALTMCVFQIDRKRYQKSYGESLVAAFSVRR